MGAVARSRQAYLVLKVFLITYLMPKSQPKRWGAPKGQVRVVIGSTLGREGRCRSGKYSVWMLDSWGWLTQPRLASNGHDFCSSRAMISVQRTASSVSK